MNFAKFLSAPFFYRTPPVAASAFFGKNSERPLFGKISKTQTSPRFKGRIPTIASLSSHTNSRELTSDLQLRKQKSKKSNNKLEIYNKVFISITSIHISVQQFISHVKNSSDTEELIFTL